MKTTRPILISVIQYINELESGALRVPDLVSRLPDLNVDGIELRRESWPDYANELAGVRDQLQAMKQMVTWATGSTLFSEDAAAQKMLLHDLDTAKALGSPLLRVFPGATPADLSDAKWANAREAVDYATSLGIDISLENWFKLPGGRLSELAYITKHIESPTLKVNIDVGNFAVHGDDVLEAIDQLGPRVNYAHLKDALDGSTTYLGGGTSPIDAIVSALEALPQPIIYCFEFQGGGEAESRIAKSLAYLREEN
ncbi:MAG: sugar phosphate isomerase/epimerase [Anaerolineae bacterium]|nr:sugar phosphate isomerase/epimerase [Anaerolineae bacterium]